MDAPQNIPGSPCFGLRIEESERDNLGSLVMTDSPKVYTLPWRSILPTLAELYKKRVRPGAVPKMEVCPMTH